MPEPSPVAARPGPPLPSDPVQAVADGPTRRRRRRRTQARATWAVVGVAALGGALAPGRPTGLRPVDVVLEALFAGLVTLAASRARRSSWLVLSGIAAVMAGGVVARIVANLALVVAFAAAVLNRRSRLLGAGVGAVAVQVLLRLPVRPLPGLGFQGASALAAAAATVPVLVSAYRLARRRTRRQARQAIAVGAVLAVVAGLAFFAALIGGRIRAELGVNQVRAGLASVQAGDDRAAGQLAAAARSLQVAHQTFGAWWARPARLLPIVSQQARALETVTGEGARLAATASSAVADADLKTLKLAGGTVDLKRLDTVQEPLERATAALARARASIGASRSGWLLAPVAHRVDGFVTQIDESAGTARTALEAVRIAPGLLGAEGPRRYFVAFITPAESRGLGGFMGNFAELSAVNGKVSLTRSGRTAELEAPAGKSPPVLSGPADYLARYGGFHPEAHIRDVPYSPDFPTDAKVMEELYQKSGGAPVDGAISVDPYALAGLLKFTGPVRIPGLDEALTADNAADLLLRQQYLRFPKQEQRIDFLDSAGRTAFEHLTAGDLPDPRTVARVLGPVVGQGRLLAHSIHPAEEALFQRVGLDGGLPPTGPGDFLSVVTQNSANNKIDIFLERDIRYSVRFDPSSGSLRATATIRLHNGAPASGLPQYVIGSSDPRVPLGTNRLYLSLYTRQKLEGASLDGAPLAMQSQRELGRPVYSAFVTLAPGSTATVVVDLSARVAPSPAYRLVLAPQPLVNPDRMTVEVHPARGWRVAPGPGFSVSEGTGRVALVPEADSVLTAVLKRS